MAFISFPTSKDIYLEANGKRLAAVGSYRAKTVRESRYIEAFGESEPIGTVGGRARHTIELSRVIACSQDTDFYSLSDFNLVIVKPDRRIIYSGCEWSDITEKANLNDTVLENVTIAATKRMEMK